MEPSHCSSLPGFRMFSGSMACLIALIEDISEARSFWKLGAFDIPTPCSPVTVPPRSMHTSKISSTAFTPRSHSSLSVGSMTILVWRFPSEAWP